MRNKTKLIRWFYVLTLVLCSCESNTLSPENFITYIEDKENGFRQAKQIGDITFNAMYKPTEYLALKRAFKNNELNKSNYFDELKQLGKLKYYQIKIGIKNFNKDMLLYHLSTEQEYYNRLNYYISNAQNDVYLINESDTLKPVLFHFERAYGVTSENTMLLAFDTKNDSAALNNKILFFDQVFNSGLIIFSFSNKIPNLEL